MSSIRAIRVIRGSKWRWKTGANRAVFFAALALAAGSEIRAAAGEERPVALPPFIVEEATKGPPWRYAEAMGYEVLSRCSDGVTRRVVEAHYNLHQLLAEILPPSLQVTMTVPRTLILYDEELQPAASQEVIARMLRPEPGFVSDEPAAFPGGRGMRVSVAPPRRVNFLPNLRLWDRDGMAVFMIVRQDDINAERLSLTHDYVSFLVKTRMPTLQPWFISGFLTLHRELEQGGGRLALDAMEWISEPLTQALKKDAKSAVPPRPLAEFFSNRFAPRPPDAAYEPIKLWQAQALLFVRWGLDPAGGERRAAFFRFVERSAVEGSTEAVFQDCFGFDFAAAGAALETYLATAVRRSIAFKPEKFAKLPPMALRNASDGQIGRIKGDWERLEVPYVKAISADLAQKYVEQARRTLKRAYDRGERDPQLLAVMGLCEADAGNDARAREYLEAAAAIGEMRPRANHELARLRLAEFRQAPEGTDGRISAGQAAEVLKPLFAARGAKPPLPEVYELIAETWACTAARPTRGHLAVLDEGVRLFPRRTALVLRSAELYLGQGFTAEATAMLDVGTLIADDDTARARIATLREKLATK